MIYFAAIEGLYSSIHKSLYDMLFGESIKETGRELKDKLRDLNDKLEDVAKEAGEDIEDIYDDFIEWIRSMDPVSSHVHAPYGKS